MALDRKGIAHSLRSEATRLITAADILTGEKKRPQGVRVLSKAARERIAEAQRQRWAKVRRKTA